MKALNIFTTERLGAMPADGIKKKSDLARAGLAGCEVAALSSSQLLELNDAQLMELAMAGKLNYLSASQLEALPAEASDRIFGYALASRMTANHVAVLPKTVLAALSGAQVAMLATAGKLKKLSFAQVSALPADSIGKVPATVLARLTGPYVMKFTAAQLAAMGWEQLTALATASQLIKLTSPQ